MKKHNYIYLGLFLLLFIYYFSIPMNIFWDTGHYMSYVSILEGTLPWSSWDIVRGLIFPLILHVSNIIFGKTTQGILFLSFIFYLIMLFSVKCILDSAILKEKVKNKKILYILIFLFVIFDPLIYGYYHALLTEFIAITISLVMCYLSFKWLNVDFNANKKKYIIYSLVFFIGTIFSWHLKQPYVTITLFPVIIASVASIIKLCNLKNIVQRSITILSCIVGLVASIFLWNQFLISKNIDLNTDRNITSSFGNQLITGLNNYEIIKDVKQEEIKDSKLLSKKEKKLLKNNNSDYYLINIKNTNGKLIDQQIISLNEKNNISTTTSIIFILKQLFNHPYLIMESYVSNYLAIANLYPKVSNDGVNYKVEKELALDYCHENCTIAISVASEKSNISYMLEESYNRVVNYEQYNDSPIVLRYLLKGLSFITTNLYKIVVILLPLLVILSTISFIKNHKDKYNNLLNIVFILSWYSLLHILVHVVTGACIDRYASPAYITIILSFILYIYYIIKTKIIIKEK